MTITDNRPTLRFLREAYGEHAEGYLSVFVGDDKKTTYWFRASDLEAAAEQSVALAERNNVFFGVGLHAGKPEKGRGTAETVCSIPGVWADIDVAGPAHKSQNLPTTLADAVEWAYKCPLEPTLIVNSGNGIQAWLLFKEPLTIESDEERQYARGLVKRFQHVMRQNGNGWDLDPTDDLARLLRLPGTVNHKHEPKMVKVIEHNLDNRYDPGEIERYLPTEEQRSARTITKPADDADFTPANLNKIASECAWMRHCCDDAASLNEPEWYASLSIIGRCVDGEQHAHDWSEPHLGYSEEQTTDKLEQALERSGPRTCEYVRNKLTASKFCDGCKHWDQITTPLQLGRSVETLVHSDTDNDNRTGKPEDAATLEHFWAYMPEHRFIYTPTGELWPVSSVNKGVPKVPTGRVNDKGKEIYEQAADWLVRNKPVQQLTWAPGESALIHDQLISHGGWFAHPGATCFNLYRPPVQTSGNPAHALHWISHVHKIYPDDAEHIINWLAHRVQRPGEKINHALVLGGPQGIGKDTLLEPPKYAVGPWNFQEVSPSHMLGRFNGFVKSVILRVSEARDLGDINRFAFYDHLKVYTAAPPDVLRVDEKNRHEYSVFNVCGVILTANEKTSGIYLPPDDRRHYVAWSDRTAADFTPEYWDFLYRWYANGGHGHVAAYLQSLDISRFNPKAPPQKTRAFWDIVDANRAPEDAELADVIDRLNNPDAVTLTQIIEGAGISLSDWLRDRKNSRSIPHRMEAVGYVRVRNDGAKDGLWVVNSKRQAIYAKDELDARARFAVASRIAGTSHSREAA